MSAVAVDSLRLYITTDYPCGYLPQRQARNLVADPKLTSQPLYDQLVHLGFRRSGEHIYRPHCEGCNACLSLRLPVDQVKLNRNQKRCLKRNEDIVTNWLSAQFFWPHYELFEQYVKQRHPNGGMDDTSPAHYQDFLVGSWSDSLLCEFRDSQQHLLAVAVVDRVYDGLSAVYTFFDPAQEHVKRSLGTFAILNLLIEAERQKLPWVYLGYWIDACDKMAYKANFRPHQVFTDNRWVADTVTLDN